ncbi:MAG: polysaccharide deacetylase family protein [Candidatus Poribacteria bacterium]
MIKVYIESYDQIIYHRIKYVMSQMLIAIGYEHTFLNNISEVNDDFSIACIPKNSISYDLTKKFDLLIPYSRYDLWTEPCPNIKSEKIEGIHILYIDEQPKFLINNRVIGFDLINIIFYLLSKQEEYSYGHRDSRDLFLPTYSTLYENGLVQIPLINYYLKYIENYIIQNSNISPKTKWKNKASYAVVLSHDLDNLPSKDITISLHQLLKSFSHHGFVSKISTIKNNLIDIFLSPSTSDWQFSYWLDKEKQYNCSSTFFIAGNTKERLRSDPNYWLSSKVTHNGQKMRLSDLAKSLEDMGWEIGLHGSYNSYKDEVLLKKEKDLLIKQTGCNIMGIRQHNLRFDVKETWSIYENLNFTYDTTLGYNEVNGFRAGIAFPFNPYDLSNEREYNLLELPMSIMDGSFFCNYGENLDLQKATMRCEKILNAVKETEGMLVVNFHPNFYTHSDSWKLYEYILEYTSRSGAWITNCKEIANWWLERRRSLTMLGTEL